MTDGPFPPEHMSRWHRNERVYRRLLAEGLVVEPIFADMDGTMIEYMLVSTVLPFDIELLNKHKPSAEVIALKVVSQQAPGEE